MLRLVKLLSKTLASVIQNTAALWFSLLLSSNYNIFSSFCSAEMLALITGFIYQYDFIYVFICLKWATSVSSVFRYVNNRQVAVEFHIFLSSHWKLLQQLVMK